MQKYSSLFELLGLTSSQLALCNLLLDSLLNSKRKEWTQLPALLLGFWLVERHTCTCNLKILILSAEVHHTFLEFELFFRKRGGRGLARLGDRKKRLEAALIDA